MFLRLLNIDRDAEAMHAIFGDPQSCAYLPEPATKTVAETKALLEKYDKGHERFSWVIIEEDESDALGRVKLMPHDESVFEAAVMIRPEAQGKGLASIAVSKALDFIFDQHAARRVFADIDPDNVASIKLFERLGFQHEGRLRATYETHLGVRDTALMSLIDTDPKIWRTT